MTAADLRQFRKWLMDESRKYAEWGRDASEKQLPYAAAYFAQSRLCLDIRNEAYRLHRRSTRRK